MTQSQRSLILALVGIWILWMAFLVFTVRSDDSLRATGTHTTAVVLSVDNASLTADVRFVSADGRQIFTTAPITDGADMPSIHDEVEVIYDPENPLRAVFPYKGGAKDWLMKWVALPIVGLAPGPLILLFVRRLRADASTRPNGQVPG